MGKPEHKGGLPSDFRSEGHPSGLEKFRSEVMPMVTYSDLFQFGILLVSPHRAVLYSLQGKEIVATTTNSDGWPRSEV